MPRRVYREGFRITTGPRGVRIEALDYHSSPLFLDPGQLAELGLGWIPREGAPGQLTLPLDAAGPAGAPEREDLLSGSRRRGPARRGTGRP